jgi:hypothetical protein
MVSKPTMASSPSATASLTVPTVVPPINIVPAAPPPANLTPPSIVTSTHSFSVKLNAKNYLAWKTQFIPILNYQNLNYLLSNPSPSPTILNAANDAIPNPAYEEWFKQNQMLLSWLFSSLTKEIFPYVINLITAKEVWTALAHTFGSMSQN